MRKNISIIKGTEMDEIFTKSDHEYLVGNFSRHQKIKHIIDEDVEIGISDYDKTNLDKPHFHPCISEYQYILKGEVIVFNLENMEHYHLREGDFYAVPKGNRRVQLSKANSRILFVKNTSMDDKQVVTVSEEVHQWIKEVWEEFDK